MYTPLNKRKISKRTGKNTVALVGFAKTRDEAPWDDLDTEIWGLNEAYAQPWMKRFDRWFQIHPEDNFSRPDNPNDPNHLNWLKVAKGFPIYMQEKFKYIPASVMYPLAEVTEKYGNYLTSSVAFMLTLAMLEGFERIELYGFEMGTRTEYHYQRANAEYLIGMAKALGFEIYLPASCGICKGKMYGFETLDVAFRQKLEYRKTSIENEVQNKRDQAKVEEGQLNVMTSFYELNKDIPEMYEKFKNQVSLTKQAQAKANYAVGCLEECKRIIDLYDEFLETVGVGGVQDLSKTKLVKDA
jgi:hypothetical protein